ncbi:hypothetical protein Bca52824_081314, partial [Brassica carinata]
WLIWIWWDHFHLTHSCMEFSHGINRIRVRNQNEHFQILCSAISESIEPTLSRT